MITYDVIQALFACRDALTQAKDNVASLASLPDDTEAQEKIKAGAEALESASKQLLAHEVGGSLILAFAKEYRLWTVGDLCACRDALLGRHANDEDEEDDPMAAFDVAPVEELGYAKNAIARVLESFRDALPSDESRQLKMAYHRLDGVQNYFFNN